MEGLRPSAARRQRRQAEREERLDRLGGWQWLYKFPLLLIFLVAIAFVGQLLDLLLFLLFLVLCAAALVEVTAQLIIGTILLVPRLLGIMRSRVDVYTEEGNHLASLTVLHVPGYTRAGQLVNTLADQRRTANWPFDPIRDPATDMTLRKYQAEIVRHESQWNAPKVERATADR